MSNAEDISGLVEQLDRQFQAMEELDGTDVLLRLPRLILFLAEDPRVSAIVVDLDAERREWLSGLQRHATNAFERLGVLWKKYQPQLQEAAAAGVAKPRGFRDGFESYGTDLARPPSVKIYGWLHRPGDPTNVGDLISTFRRWAVDAHAWTEQTRGKLHADLSALVLALKLLETQHRYVVRRHRSESRHSGGFSYERLVKIAEAANPLAPMDESAVDEHAIRTHLSEEQVARPLHDLDNIASSGITALDRTIAQAKADARVVHEEVRLRLGRLRSRIAIVRRFAARCESFDQRRLTVLIGRSKRRVEAELTLEFAKYLFDVGFNPLVDAAACGLRPDVLDATARPAVYVEAKQYKRVTKVTHRQLAQAVAQAFNTWHRLSNRFEVPEAFLLVFRRGGLTLSLPEHLTLKGKQLVLQVVDIAPPEQAGSRLRTAPLVMSEADLLLTFDKKPRRAKGSRRSR